MDAPEISDSRLDPVRRKIRLKRSLVLIALVLAVMAIVQWDYVLGRAVTVSLEVAWIVAIVLLWRTQRLPDFFYRPEPHHQSQPKQYNWVHHLTFWSVMALTALLLYLVFRMRS
jgi:hypothetical protein